MHQRKVNQRLRRFGESFRSVVKAQVEISAVNTALTVLFVFAILPAFGARLPLAGTLVAKKATPQDAGSFPVSGTLFVVLLTSTVVIVGALTFFPALTMGPVVEHFLMTGSSTTF